MIENKKSLSIVIPCYNEEEVVIDTYMTLTEHIKGLSNISEYEIVFVNNGSTDNTFEKIYSLYEKDDRVVLVDLRNNFGFQGSITAGLFHASKDMIVTIDADLQDDYTKIKEMIERHYEGYDLVLGVRENRDKDSYLKKFTAQSYYKLLNKMGIKVVYNHADFRLMSNSLLKDFKKYTERNRYIRGIILGLESRYACVYYTRKPREKGESKFNLSSLVSLAIDGITSFSPMPIRFISLFGIVMFMVSIFGIFYVMYEKFINGENVPGWAFTSILIMLFGGLNSLFVGLVGEYIGKTYTEVKQRPMFVVRKKYSRK